ncbi:MAG: hypothetical protein V1760_03220 [Candidatus Peregrinibacteria bacterium]
MKSIVRGLMATLCVVLFGGEVAAFPPPSPYITCAALAARKGDLGVALMTQGVAKVGPLNEVQWCSFRNGDNYWVTICGLPLEPELDSQLVMLPDGSYLKYEAAEGGRESFEKGRTYYFGHFSESRPSLSAIPALLHQWLTDIRVTPILEGHRAKK